MQWWLWVLTCLLCGVTAWYIGRRQGLVERDRDREREHLNQSVQVQAHMANLVRQNKEDHKDLDNQQQSSFNNEQSLSFSSNSVKSEKGDGETADLQLMSGVLSQGSGRRRIRKRES